MSNCSLPSRAISRKYPHWELQANRNLVRRRQDNTGDWSKEQELTSYFSRISMWFTSWKFMISMTARLRCSANTLKNILKPAPVRGYCIWSPPKTTLRAICSFHLKTGNVQKFRCQAMKQNKPQKLANAYSEESPSAISVFFPKTGNWLLFRALTRCLFSILQTLTEDHKELRWRSVLKSKKGSIMTAIKELHEVNFQDFDYYRTKKHSGYRMLP